MDLAQCATFSCSATTDDVTYQWIIASGSFPHKVPGINEKTLVIPEIRSTDQNTYTCEVSNADGSIESNPADLSVTGELTTVNPYVNTVCCKRNEVNPGINYV